MNLKRAQQEMVGFVLIIVLVVVAMMVFLVISMNKPLVSVESEYANSMLTSVLAYTTDCVVSEPDIEDMMKLVIDCKENKKCGNMNKMACEYMNETLTKVMRDLADSDNTIKSYKFRAYFEEDDEDKATAFYTLSTGDCVIRSNSKLTSERMPLTEKISVTLELCVESDS
jgi:hypothetical protein